VFSAPRAPRRSDEDLDSSRCLVIARLKKQPDRRASRDPGSAFKSARLGVAGQVKKRFCYVARLLQLESDCCIVARTQGGRTDGPQSWDGVGAYPPSIRSRIVLFDQTRYRGSSWTVESPQSIVSGAGRAESLQIYGGTWEVCAGQNWAPPCLRLSESQSDLRDFGFDNRIVSVRPVGARPR
jgi:hypothetical protein